MPSLARTLATHSHLSGPPWTGTPSPRRSPEKRGSRAGASRRLWDHAAGTSDASGCKCPFLLTDSQPAPFRWLSRPGDGARAAGLGEGGGRAGRRESRGGRGREFWAALPAWLWASFREPWAARVVSWGGQSLKVPKVGAGVGLGAGRAGPADGQRPPLCPSDPRWGPWLVILFPLCPVLQGTGGGSWGIRGPHSQLTSPTITWSIMYKSPRF